MSVEMTSSPRERRGSLRMAVLGREPWISLCAPPSAPRRVLTLNLTDERDPRSALTQLRDFAPHATVLLDPLGLPEEILARAPGVTLGVLVAGLPDAAVAPSLRPLERLVSFDPGLTGSRVGDLELWRAVPPPISDVMFAVRGPRGTRPRAMTIGSPSEHREWMLLPAKHHHDLLEVLHGVHGEDLREMLAEYDVGVHVPRMPTGAHSPAVGLHLAAGQLLLSGELTPSHGLERGIDYVQVDTPDALVWLLDRLERFPDMYRSVRVRGQMKAEQFRASRLLARLAHDLLADVAAFGATRA